MHIIRWTIRDAETKAILTEASGEGELDVAEPYEEADSLLEDLRDRDPERFGATLRAELFWVTIEVEVLELGTEWGRDGRYHVENTAATARSQRVLPAA